MSCPHNTEDCERCWPQDKTSPCTSKGNIARTRMRRCVVLWPPPPLLLQPRRLQTRNQRELMFGYSILNLIPGQRNVTPKHVSCLGAIAAPQEVRFPVVFRLSTLLSVESLIESLNGSKFLSFNTFLVGRDSPDGVDYAWWGCQSGVYWTFSFIAALFAVVESLFMSTIFITFSLLY